MSFICTYCRAPQLPRKRPHIIPAEARPRPYRTGSFPEPVGAETVREAKLCTPCFSDYVLVLDVTSPGISPFSAYAALHVGLPIPPAS